MLAARIVRAKMTGDREPLAGRPPDHEVRRKAADFLSRLADVLAVDVGANI